MTNILVYRDLLGARSEAFVQRQYCAFAELEPIFVGTKRGPHAPKDSLILAARGVFGAPRRLLFRQFGVIPGSLRRVVDARRPELIHAQFGLGGALALPLAESFHLPLVVTFHGGDATKDKHFRDGGLVRTIFQRRRAALCERATVILCVSHFIRDSLIDRGFPTGKLEVHHIGIDIPKDVMLPPTGSSRTVLFVGRLVAKKGVDVLIDAIARARQIEPDLELVIVGDGPDRAALQSRAATAGVPAQFRGWQDAKQVQTAMRRAMLLAVPSRTAPGGDAEGLPTVVMEAMALGLPVVASRHAGIPEIVSDGVTGLLVPENDSALLADSILRIRRDPDLAGRLRGEAYADVRARFDARRQSARLERRLIEIIRVSEDENKAMTRTVNQA